MLRIDLTRPQALQYNHMCEHSLVQIEGTRSRVSGRASQISAVLRQLHRVEPVVARAEVAPNMNPHISYEYTQQHHICPSFLFTASRLYACSVRVRVCGHGLSLAGPGPLAQGSGNSNPGSFTSNRCYSNALYTQMVQTGYCAEESVVTTSERPTQTQPSTRATRALPVADPNISAGSDTLEPEDARQKRMLPQMHGSSSLKLLVQTYKQMVDEKPRSCPGDRFLALSLDYTQRSRR